MVELLQKTAANRQAQDQCESKLLAEKADADNMEESSVGGAADTAVLSSSCPVRTADFTCTALVQDRGGDLPVGGAEQEEDAESPGDFEALSGRVRQLQQELAGALKKQSTSEASLAVTMCYHSDLEEDKLRLQKELDRTEAELRELEEERLQSEHCVHNLKAALNDKEREVLASSQKLQDLLLTSSGTSTTIKQLEDHVQRLEIENARLEATVQQQNSRTEALQRDLQASASHDSEGQQVRTLAVGICTDEVHLCEELRINFELQEDCNRLNRLLNRAMKKLSLYEEREKRVPAYFTMATEEQLL